VTWIFFALARWCRSDASSHREQIELKSLLRFAAKILISLPLVGVEEYLVLGYLVLRNAHGLSLWQDLVWLLVLLAVPVILATIWWPRGIKSVRDTPIKDGIIHGFVLCFLALGGFIGLGWIVSLLWQ
jgi:hypothetical protein